MSKTKAPRRRYFIELSAGGDTKEDLIWLVRDWLSEFEASSRDIDIITGSGTCGGQVRTTTDFQMDHKKYMVAIAERIEGHD